MEAKCTFCYTWCTSNDINCPGCDAYVLNRPGGIKFKKMLPKSKPIPPLTKDQLYGINPTKHIDRCRCSKCKPPQDAVTKSQLEHIQNSYASIFSDVFGKHMSDISIKGGAPDVKRTIVKSDGEKETVEQWGGGTVYNKCGAREVIESYGVFQNTAKEIDDEVIKLAKADKAKAVKYKKVADRVGRVPVARTNSNTIKVPAKKHGPLIKVKDYNNTLLARLWFKFARRRNVV